MKIFDMHIHTNTEDPHPEQLIEAFDRSGTFGGCIFSTRPNVEDYHGIGLDFDARMRQLLRWSEGYEDRIYPVIWMHPDEGDTLRKIKLAAEHGVAGYKFIATSYSPSDERFLEIAEAIAETGKPLFLHSGIHYCSQNFHYDMDYNRPSAFMKLTTVPGLRFSMGHCSWPWIDECLAFFGKWSHYMTTLPKEKRSEMFLDITPGTPELYREELLTKLYRFPQNTGDFIMHGTDGIAESYNAEAVSRRIDNDRRILDRLGVSRQLRERAYHDNLMRFLGKKEYTESFTFRAWGFRSTTEEPKEIARKWYKKLGFLPEYDKEFERALKEIPISDAITVEKYDPAEQDGKRNLLSVLYFCEALAKRYEEKGIEESVLLDTLGDIPIWTNLWSELRGELYLGELSWLANHLKMRLFRIGSLEYMMGKAPCDCPELGLKKGDNVLDMHIPHNSPLSPEECRRSLRMARDFFAKHYPEFRYSHFSCHSWLLDTELAGMLKPGSNILAFQEIFHIIEGSESESFAALRYIFDWGTSRINLRNAYPVSSFAERVKRHVLGGGKLYERTGVIPVSRIDE